MMAKTGLHEAIYLNVGRDGSGAPRYFEIM
jgi:hypothetical protein